MLAWLLPRAHITRALHPPHRTAQCALFPAFINSDTAAFADAPARPRQCGLGRHVSAFEYKGSFLWLNVAEFQELPHVKLLLLLLLLLPGSSRRGSNAKKIFEFNQLNHYAPS
jgi:hypothetical protein